MFKKPCDRASVDTDEKPRAFSIMLNDRTRDYYFGHLHGKNLTFDNMTDSVKTRFIRAEHDRTLVREWDNFTRNVVMERNANKHRKFCLELIVSGMQELQSGLPASYRNDEIFRNKLLNAVKEVDACKLAYY